jgi:signal transduction histidine kinase/tetratricopeptide (TPR) repeat protein
MYKQSSNKIWGTILFLFLGIVFGVGQVRAEEINPDTLRLKIHELIGQGDSTAETEALRLLQWAEERNDLKWKAIAKINLGRVAWQVSDHEAAEQWLWQSIGSYEQLGDSLGVGNALLELAISLRRIGQYDKAFQLGSRAQAIAESYLPTEVSKELHLLGFAYNVLGLTYLDLEEHQKAFEHLGKAHTTFLACKAAGDSINARTALANQALALRKMGEEERALAFFIKLEKEEKHAIRLSLTWGHLSELYHLLGNDAKALEYAEKMYHFDMEHGDRFGRLSEIQINRAEAFGGLGRHAEARQAFEDALDLALTDSIKHPAKLEIVYSHYIDYLQAQKDFERAWELQRDLVKVKEKEFKKKLESQLADAQVKYETDRKDQEIKFLNLEKVQDRRDRLFLWAGLIGIATIALVIGLGYRNSRRQARLLQQQNVQIQRLLMDKEVLVQDLKSAQDQLIQAEKMASLGQLTAGIAHELNNPVAFISGNATALAMDFQELEPQLVDFPDQDLVAEMNEAIAGLQRGSKRIQEIVSGLRTFSYDVRTAFAREDINRLLDENLNILAAKMNQISIEKDYGEFPEVLCQGNRLGQVFLNVMDNSVAAMPSGGSLRLKTRQDGESVLINISDTGVGMDHEILKKIFDPFFTTKEVGEGTGLGMAISYGIIQDHRGKIEVLSQEGEGTEVILTLPITQSETSSMVT